MGYTKVSIPPVVFHFTKKKNLDSIMSDQKIRRFDDTECWFCRSKPDMLRYMQMTVLCEGKPFVDVDGRIKRYPKFNPDDYVVLKLTPRYREGNWYQWNQVLPSYASPEVIAEGKEFSRLKVGFRGDLRFKECEVIDMAEILEQNTEQVQGDGSGPVLSM